jgi:hypothetical protein
MFSWLLFVLLRESRLGDYPFVVVRRLRRNGLAVLAERFGADAEMVEVLGDGRIVWRT